MHDRVDRIGSKIDWSTFSIHRVEGVAGPSGETVYFECDEHDAKYEELLAFGVRFASAPEDKRWLWREARWHDASGNEICLFHAGDNRKNPPWRLTES